MRRAIATISIPFLLSPVPANGQGKKPLTFEVLSMGEIKDKAATDAGFKTKLWSYAHFGFTEFRASNGSGAMVYYDDFSTPEEAKKFLDWSTARAFKVLSQSTKTDAHGKPMEYRAAFIPDYNHSLVERMWVVGTDVHWIRASTLQDALKLEKWYRH